MTDHERDVVVDLEEQRKIRSRQVKAVGRLLKDVRAMKEKETAVTISLVAVRDKSTDLNNIIRRAARCMDLLFDGEEDEETITADEKVRLRFNQQAEEVCSLCQNMGAFKRSHLLSESIEDSLKDVEALKEADASMDCSACTPDIQKQLDEMTTLLRDSTIHPNDNLRKKAKLLKTRLLKAKSHKREDSEPLTLIKSDSEKDFNMPKMNIPKFKGGLAEWHAFWSRFRTAVYNNKQMTEQVKMAHLIDMVTDPALNDYMVAANDGKEGRYQQAVDYLQARFNRPRELHSIHCRNE